MPRADDLPAIVVGSNEVPSQEQPARRQGRRRGRDCVGALPAVMNAINDALAPLGIRHLDMPATPERLWRAIARATHSGHPTR